MATCVYIIADGNDYKNETLNVTIPAENFSVAFNISIIDDDIFEINESFTVTIDSSSLPHGFIVPAEDCMMMITIVDDDGQLLDVAVLMIFE